MSKRNSITLNILLYLHAIRKGDTEHDPFMPLSKICPILEKEFDTQIARSSLRFRYKRMVTTGVVKKNYPPINLEDTYADFCKNYLNKVSISSRTVPTVTATPTEPTEVENQAEIGVVSTGSTEAELIRKLLPQENRPSSVAKPFVRPDENKGQPKTTEEGVVFDITKFQARD